MVIVKDCEKRAGCRDTCTRSVLAESPGMRPSKEAYRRDGCALVLDAVEVHGRGSASSIIVGASCSRPARGRRVLDWRFGCQRKGGILERKGGHHPHVPYLGYKAWRYYYSLPLNPSSTLITFEYLYARCVLCNESCLRTVSVSLSSSFSPAVQAFVMFHQS
jgi:hypothetical protein